MVSGCALIDAKVNPIYKADGDKKSPLSTISPMRIAVVVTDNREAEVRNRVGDVRNNYGMITAKVVAEREPATIVQDAIRTELANNGHNVAEPQARPQATIRVSLTKFWSDAHIRLLDLEMLGILNADVSVCPRDSNAPQRTKPLAMTFRHSAQLCVAGTYEQSLNGALREFVRALACDPTILEALRQIRSSSGGY